MNRRLIALILVLATVAVFLPSLDNGFVGYDDGLYVTQNAEVQRGLTGDGIAWALTAKVAGNWHPLTLWSHLLDCTLFGLNPRGHHLTNLLLHAANTVLLFLLFFRLTATLWRSAALAALWALHPLRVESVAWVAERKDVLAGLFFLLALLGYERWSRDRSRTAYLLVIGAMALGLMAKPMLVTLPGVLLLLDFWPLGRTRSGAGWWIALKPLLIEKLPLFALSAASSWITLRYQEAALVSGMNLSLWGRLANLVLAPAQYIRVTLWPSGLAVLYPLPDDLPIGKTLLAVLVLATVSVLAFHWRRTAPFLGVGWLWFLGMLVPVVGVVQVGAQAWADRYTYLPGIGLLVMLVWSATALVEKLPRRLRVPLAAGLTTVLLAGCAVATRRQIAYWHDDTALWRRAVAVTGENYVAELNLALELVHDGDRASALEHFERAQRIAPESMEVQAGFGAALGEWGRPAEAVPHFRAAIRLRPGDPRPRVDLARALIGLGDRRQAIEELRRALEVDPTLPGVAEALRRLEAEAASSATERP
ncbi:MAG: tetratricopeptide repeat protein [Acidobacteriota bacterium]